MTEGPSAIYDSHVPQVVFGIVASQPTNERSHVPCPQVGTWFRVDGSSNAPMSPADAESSSLCSSAHADGVRQLGLAGGGHFESDGGGDDSVEDASHFTLSEFLEPDGTCGFVRGPSLQLAEDADLCKKVVAALEEAASPATCISIVRWLLPAVLPVAVSEHGCWVVQKALEVVGSSGRDALVVALTPHAQELYESQHGNHVLTKVIERVPAATLGPIVLTLIRCGSTAVSRHRFGCRVMERLIEHCSEDDLGDLISPVVADCEAMARHAFGNFVIQHLLEHGSTPLRVGIVLRLLPVTPYLATHRTASHVVQRILDFSDEEFQCRVMEVFLASTDPDLVGIACSRYGSFVVEQLACFRLGLGRKAELATTVASHLAGGSAYLLKSQFGRRVVSKFGLFACPSPAVAGGEQSVEQGAEPNADSH